MKLESVEITGYRSVRERLELPVDPQRVVPALQATLGIAVVARCPGGGLRSGCRLLSLGVGRERLVGRGGLLGGGCDATRRHDLDLGLGLDVEDLAGSLGSRAHPMGDRARVPRRAAAEGHGEPKGQAQADGERAWSTHGASLREQTREPVAAPVPARKGLKSHPSSSCT